MDEKFHNYRARLLKLLKAIESSGMCQENKAALRRFCDECKAHGLSDGAVLRYVDDMREVEALLSKPFSEVTRDDVLRAVGRIETGPHADWTKNYLKVTIKKFFKWFRGTEDYPEEVRWLKTSIRKALKKLPEELLSADEVNRMIACATNARDRALVATLYDSGCRIGELGTLSIKHVQFDKFGAVITVNGKTGMRRVRLVPSVPSLAQWLSFHPRRADPESPLWLSSGDASGKQRLNYGGITEIVRRLACKAGIKKRIHPHLFRHSSATFWADKLTEAQMNERFGWVQGSKQAATYVHLSGRQVDDSVLKAYGLKRDDATDLPKLAPRTCPRCKTQNETSAKLCVSCGMALDHLAAIEAEKEVAAWNTKMAKLVMDPEVQSILLKKLQEMDSQGTARSA